MASKVICCVILGIFLLNNFDGVATTLECYSCTATLGSNFRCENLSYSGGSLPYYTCMYGDAVCAKYIIEYGDSLMIHRSCQHRDICAVLASRYNNYYSKLLDCQTCSDHNYCNDAVTTAPAAPTTAAATAFVLVGKLLRDHVLYYYF